MNSRLVCCTTILLAMVCVPLHTASAQSATADPGDWSSYGGDAGFNRYVPLDQINRDNVSSLKQVWRWNSIDEPLYDGPERLRRGFFKSTPLMVGGRLFVSTALNQVAAVDAGTGETLWEFNPRAYNEPGGRNVFQHRGVGYWTDGTDERVIMGTTTRQLIALNAKTGELYPDFGENGLVDMGKGLDRPIEETQLRFTAPPMIIRDTIILGCVMPDEASNPGIPPGHIRGYDVRTGALKWVFYNIPRKGEFGYETWEDGSAETAGAANVWSMMSGDEELGYVYLPTGTPANDFYGGHRPGDTLFAESIVCLNAETGERVWHFQGVHHGLWDYDFPSAPMLVDLTVDGKPIKALAQASKQAFTYVLDRATGEPVWPIEERAVPQSTVPGEKTSPTQPFPTKPPPFDLQGLTEDDLIDFTPELRQEALDYIKNYTTGPMFTPPSLLNEDGTGATIQVPGAAGGSNWGSAGVDPETGIMYVQSATQPSLAGLVQPDPNRSRFKYMRGGDWGLPPRASGLPLTKPPYGRITAIDLNKGEILWQVPHGEGPKNHPKLKDLNLGDLGAPSNTMLSNSGCVITKTMVIYSHVEVNPDGSWSDTNWWLIGYDKQTGERVWKEKLELPPYAVPMSYMHEGKQYIVVGAGGGATKTGLLAYALPD